MIRKGDKIRIRPEWMDKGDDEFEWTAIDDEEKGRVTIRCEIPNMNIKPTSVVHVYMIEKVEND